MPLSNPAKIALGVLAGGATVALAGIGIAHARKPNQPKKSKKKRDDDAPKMPRGDGSAPTTGDVVEVAFERLQDDSEFADGFPITVGTRYVVRLPADVQGEIEAGRRIAEVTVAKVVNGELNLSKRFGGLPESFDLVHNDLRVAFDLETKLVSLTATRAGLYAVGVRDGDESEVFDDMLLLATSPAPSGAA